MPNAFAVAETYDHKTQNNRIFMQLGLFGLVFLALIAIADVSPAYGSCAGVDVASISGPLLPTTV